MDKDPHQANRQTWPIWAVGGAVVLVGGLLFSGVLPQLDAPGTEPAARESAERQAARPAEQAAEQAEAPPENTPADEPRFDLVRVEADGATVVAGQAKPNAKVSVVLDGQTLADTTADTSGNFVVFVALQPDDEPRVMWLMAETGDGDILSSVETVVITPGAQMPVGSAETVVAAAQPEAPEEEPTNAVTEPGVAEITSIRLPTASAEQSTALSAPETASTVTRAGQVSTTGSDQLAALAPDVSLSAPPEQPAGAQEAEAVEDHSAPAAPAAPRVLLSGRDGIQALDVPRLPNRSDLRIDTIDYGNDNTVVLRGRAGSEGDLQVALDGKVRAAGQTSPDGVWTLVIEDVPEGLYDLKVESLDATGSVLGRAEVPFRREAPEIVEDALAERGAKIVTVQPGATLWAIARDRYGAGTRYVQVFEANRDQIRNPDLIYPGQVFDLPQ